MNYIFDPQFKDNDTQKNRYPVPVSTIEQPPSAAAVPKGFKPIAHTKYPAEWKIAAGRLNATRAFFNRGLFSIDDAVFSFEIWRQKNYLLFSEDDINFYAGLAAKRGNGIWEYRVKERFKDFELHNPVEFFNPSWHNRNLKFTNMVFLTLTRAHDEPLAESWTDFTKHFNRFVAALRKEFHSPVYVVRNLESHESAYPHAHVILYIPNHNFAVAYRQEKIKDGELTTIFRLMAKHRFEKHWKGQTDIQACYNSDIMEYLTKHNCKMCKRIDANSSRKHMLTLAMTWMFRKRTFSISKQIREVFRVHFVLHNSNQRQTSLTEHPKTLRLIGGIFMDSTINIPISEYYRTKYRKDEAPPEFLALVERVRAMNAPVPAVEPLELEPMTEEQIRRVIVNADALSFVEKDFEYEQGMNDKKTLKRFMETDWYSWAKKFDEAEESQ